MAFHVRIALAMLVALVCLKEPVQVLAQGSPTASRVQTLADLDREVRRVFDQAAVPGAGFVVIEKSGIVLSGSHGLADVEARKPVTAETVFRAGSISKSFTGIGVMMLVAEGKIDLNAKVADLLPELAFDNPWEQTHPLRLVHLLEHTTGFDDIAYRHYLIEGKQIPLSQAVVMYGPYKSRWRPGERVSYCNAGPVIAGRIIEKVTGQSFQEFMTSRLTGPLGMKTAYWTREPQIEAALALSYGTDGKTPERFMDIPARPSGSLNVTPVDLARLPLLMLGRGTLDGITYFPVDVAQRIEAPESSNAVKAGLKNGYGKGVLASPGARALFYGHDGSIDGFVAKYEYAPELGAGFVVMANAPSEALFTVGDLIRGYLERGVPFVRPQNVPPDAAGLDDFAGQYKTISPRQEIISAIVGLTQWNGVRVDGQDLSYMGNRLVHVGGNVFQRPNESSPSLVFERTPDGVRLHALQGSSRLVPSWELWAKNVSMGLFGLAAILSLLHAAIWLPGWLLGRLKERGGVSIRLLPFAAVLSVSGVVLGVMVLLAIDDLALLGGPSLPARALHVLSLAAPVFVSLALFRVVLGAAGASMAVRGFSLFSAVMAAIACAYLWHHGWIGIEIWN
jgi:CubicO group peptidase (beta-lactamase class C family)